MANFTQITQEGAFDSTVRNQINANLLQAARVVTAPAAANSTGNAGDIAFDATHIYYCVASGTWVRATLAAW